MYTVASVNGIGVDKCHQTLFLLLFFIHFRPNFASHSLPIFSSLCLPLLCFLSLCLSCSRTDDKNTIQLVLLVTKQLVYWTTDIPKQSCCGSSSTQSCAGTSSTATECSHHSKFRTSRTRSTTLGARGPGNQQKHLEYIAGSGWKYLPLTHW